MILTTDTDDADDADADGGEYYYFNNLNGSFTDARMHRRKNCRVAVRAAGPVQPINSSSVDEYDAEWCPHCSPQMGSQYPVPDPDGFDLVDAGGGEHRLHLPGDVRVRFDAVREHEAGFHELVRNGEVVGTVAEFDGWPDHVVEQFKEVDPPADRRRTFPDA